MTPLFRAYILGKRQLLIYEVYLYICAVYQGTKQSYILKLNDFLFVCLFVCLFGICFAELIEELARATD